MILILKSILGLKLIASLMEFIEIVFVSIWGMKFISMLLLLDIMPEVVPAIILQKILKNYF